MSQEYRLKLRSAGKKARDSLSPASMLSSTPRTPYNTRYHTRHSQIRQSTLTDDSRTDFSTYRSVTSSATATNAQSAYTRLDPSVYCRITNCYVLLSRIRGPFSGVRSVSQSTTAAVMPLNTGFSDESDDDRSYFTSDVSMGSDSRDSTSVKRRNGRIREMSDNENLECAKTGYTYAKSFTYASRATPSRLYPSPNMSREILHSSRPQLPMLMSGDRHGAAANTSFSLLRMSTWSTSSTLNLWASSDRSGSGEQPLPDNRDHNGSIIKYNHVVRYNYGLDSDSDDGTHTPHTGGAVCNVNRSLKFRETFKEVISRWSSSSVLSVTSYLVNCKQFWSFLYGILLTALNFNVWLLSACAAFCRKHLWLLLPLLLLLLSCGGWWLLGCFSDEHNEDPEATVSVVDGVRLLGDLFVRSSVFATNFVVHIFTFVTSFLVQNFAFVTSFVVQSLAPVPNFFVGIWRRTVEQQFPIVLKTPFEDRSSSSSFFDMVERQKMASVAQDWKERYARLEEIMLHLQNKYEHLAANQRNCSLNHSEYSVIAKQQVAVVLDEVLKSFDSSGGDMKSRQGRFGNLKHWIVSYFGWSKEEVTKEVGVMQENVKAALLLVMKSEIQAEVGALAQQIVPNKQEIVISKGDSVTEKEVKTFIQDALLLYGADKTGLADFALESAGAAVVSTRCSVTYKAYSALLTVFGFPVYWLGNSARTVIQSGVQPGECWAFAGSQGYLVISLAATVSPKSFSYEHIPRSLSQAGNIDSAPRDFSVWGLQDVEDKDGVLLGTYEYDQNGNALQFFMVDDSNVGAFPLVELKILSNHGHPDYTCLYRFRVHGISKNT